MPKYRHIRRYREIANSVVRHGFGQLITQLGLAHYLPSVRRARRANKAIHTHTPARRLRMLLEELGPTFVKAGQMLSTRPDLLPRDVLSELSCLQDSVPSFPFPMAKEIIEKELGKPLAELYMEFDPQPLAAASIGQVHRARLPGGDEVVVKVRRPQIGEQISSDLEILLEIARIAERRTVWGRIYRLTEVVLELRRSMEDELDYLVEAGYTEQIRANLGRRDDVLIPKVYYSHTTKAVLTTQWIDGIKLSRRDDLLSAGHNPTKIISALVDVTYEQIFNHGLFHADPHPGNLAITKDGRLVLMDFGIVGRLRGERKRQFILFLLGIIARSPAQLVRSLSDMGVFSRRVNRKALHRDAEILLDKYLDAPLHKINLGQAVSEIFILSYEHQIRIPAEFTLLGKTIMTLEGVIEDLDQEVRLIGLLQPYVKRLTRERFSFDSVKQAFLEQFLETSDFLLALPRRLNDILERTETEGLPLQMHFPDLDRAFYRMERYTNRLSFSIVLLSFSIIMAGLIIGAGLVATVHTDFVQIWRLPIIEAGFILAGAMALWLLFSIFRSGKL